MYPALVPRAICRVSMIVLTSGKSRRLVVRLERGEDLVRAIETLAQREGVRAGWVRGVGSLSWVELDRHDQTRRGPEPPQRFDIPCDILTLEGSLAMTGDAIRATLFATLARRTDNGVDVLGGRVRAGLVFHAELVIEAFDDLVLSRQHDDRTGLTLWVGTEEERDVEADRTIDDEPETQLAPKVSWADVAAVSAAPPAPPSKRTPPDRSSAHDRRRRAEEEFLSAPLPGRGDFIDHMQFGVCKVDREDEEGGLVVRLPSGVRKTIRLDFMDVGAPRHENERRIFPVRPRRR
jgi:predicted DNA-binding protein with PD1-like motif